MNKNNARIRTRKWLRKGDRVCVCVFYREGGQGRSYRRPEFSERKDLGGKGKRGVCNVPEAKGINCFKKEAITCCW